MAILNYGPHNVDPYAEMKFDTEDIAIGGKMVVGSIVVNVETIFKLQSEAEFAQYVKKQLATQLAEYLIENKLLEFTTGEDAVNQTKMIRVRGYLTPDSQVKLLRVHKKTTI
jgi:hypothetical protein